MIAPSVQTTSFLGLCNTSTHTCDKKYKLSCLWLQDHSWRFRSTAPLMTREGNNFCKTGSWDSLRNNIGRRPERAFVYKTLYKKEAHYSLSEKPWKPYLGLAYDVLQILEKIDRDLGFKQISYGLFTFAYFCWFTTFDRSNLIFNWLSLAKIE